MKRWAPLLAGLAAFLAMTASIFDPAVQLFYRDTGLLYYPVKKFMAEELRHGRLPLWDPWSEAGVSLLGQMSPGLFHPFSLLYLVFPFDLAFKLNHLLPLFLAGLGVFLLARRLGASTWAAMCGAVVYGGCGYLITQASSNLIFAVGPCTVPFALERLLAAHERPSATRILVASLLLALSALGGEPQSMLIGGLIGSAWLIAPALFAAAADERKRRAGRALIVLAAWGGLALLLAAPAALPAVHQLRRSDRAGGLRDWERQRFFVPVLRWPGLAVAGAFDDAPEVTAPDIRESGKRSPYSEYFAAHDEYAFAPSLYLGTPALLLALFAGVRRRGLFLLGGAFLFLLAAGGDQLGVYPLLARTIPGFGFFRYAEKMAAPLSLLLALACALGAEEAFSSPKRKTILACLAGGAALLLFAGSATTDLWSVPLTPFLLDIGRVHDPAVPARFFKALAPALRTEAWLSFALALVALASRLRPALRGTRALAAAICAVAVLLGSTPNLQAIPIEHYHLEPATAGEMKRRAGPSFGRWRMYAQAKTAVPYVGADPKVVGAVHGRESLIAQYPSLYELEATNSYFSAQDVAYGVLVGSAPVQALELLANRFVLLQKSDLSANEAAQSGFEPTHFGLWLRDARRNPPRATLLDSAEAVQDLDALVQRVLAPEVSVQRTALLLPGDASLAAWPARGTTGSVSYARRIPGRISLEAKVSGRALLAVSEHFDSGWSAAVDGAEAPVAQLDGLILGVPLERGAHRVELSYWPRGLTTGLLAAGIGLLLTLLVGALTTRVTTGKTYPVKTARSFSLPVARPLL